MRNSRAAIESNAQIAQNAVSGRRLTATSGPFFSTVEPVVCTRKAEMSVVFQQILTKTNELKEMEKSKTRT